MKKILLIGLAVTTLLYGCGEEKINPCETDYDRVGFILVVGSMTNLEEKHKRG